MAVVRIVGDRRGTMNHIGLRLWIGFACFLAQVLVGAIGWFLIFLATGSFAWYVVDPALGPDSRSDPLAIAFLVSLGGAVMIAARTRPWAHRLRARRLRRSGSRVTALVTGIQVLVTPTRPGQLGMTSYVVDLRWADPATGAELTGQREYKFWGRPNPEFESVFTRAGSTVPVLFDPRKPARMVIDVPFTPSMADFFV
jgi:Protein of unknown function (DUF3592)